MSRPASTRVGAPSPLGAFILGVRFLTELALIAAAAWAGAARTRSIPLGIALGVLAAVVVATVWGVWIAPASRRRLPDPVRLLLELVLFAAAAAGLVLAGRSVVGAVIGVVGAVTAVAVRFVRQPERAAQREDDADTEPGHEPMAAETPGTQAVTPAPEVAAPLRRPRGRDRARPRN
jgi:hypothetical protein